VYHFFRSKYLMVLLALLMSQVLSSPSLLAESSQSIRHGGIVIQIKSGLQGPKNYLEVVLDLPTKTREQSFSLTDPNRIVIDLPGIKIGRPASFALDKIASVSKVRLGVHPDKTRVVIDISEYEIPEFVVRLSSEPEAIPEIQQLTSPVAVIPPALPVSAEVSFSLDTMHVWFEPSQRPVKDIVVKNQSKQPLYFTSISYKVQNPGKDESAQVETQDLLVSPKRFSLSSLEERTIRIIHSPEHAKDEKVYRVHFLATGQPFEDLEVVDPVTSSHKRPNLVTGIALLATVDPLTPKPELSWERLEHGVEIINRGNLQFLIDNGKVCSRESHVCREIPSKRIYAGNSWTVPLNRSERFEFIKQSGSRFERFVIEDPE